MKRFSHRNIVGLLGVCFDTPEGYPYLVLPFMTNGNIGDWCIYPNCDPGSGCQFSISPDDCHLLDEPT